MYLTYHDFVGNTPLIFGSTNGGASFSPLGFGGTGAIFGPTDPGFADARCNTLVGKPVADAAGTIYILTNTSTVAEDLSGGCAGPAPLDRFYLSVSTDGGHSFTSQLISDLSAAGTGKATSGSWGHVFNQLAIDAGGNLYIDASATLDGTLPLQNYLLVSRDHGAHFSAPILTNAQPGHGQLFPAIAVGQAGQVAVGYYQGLKKDHLAAQNNFQFMVDETLNALDASPVFTHTQLTPLSGTTPQPDGICTQGLLCVPGQPNNRNLADFESMTVDGSGHLEIVIPADSDGSTTENWFYKQTTGPLLVPGATNGNGTGNQTWVSGASVTPTPQPVASGAPEASPTPRVLPNTAAAPLQGFPGAGALAGLVILCVLGAGLAWRRSTSRL